MNTLFPQTLAGRQANVSGIGAKGLTEIAAANQGWPVKTADLHFCYIVRPGWWRSSTGHQHLLR